MVFHDWPSLLSLTCGFLPGYRQKSRPQCKRKTKHRQFPSLSPAPHWDDWQGLAETLTFWRRGRAGGDVGGGSCIPEEVLGSGSGSGSGQRWGLCLLWFQSLRPGLEVGLRPRVLPEVLGQNDCSFYMPATEQLLKKAMNLFSQSAWEVFWMALVFPSNSFLIWLLVRSLMASPFLYLIQKAQHLMNPWIWSSCQFLYLGGRSVKET